MAKNLNKDAVYRAAKAYKKRITKSVTVADCRYWLKPDGSKRWQFVYYRFDGKQNTLGFGIYPGTTLENARRKAEEARKQIANGTDPAKSETKPKKPSNLPS